MIESREKKKDLIVILELLILIIISFTISLSMYDNPFSVRPAGNDSSMFQYFGYAMSRGDSLYTDIFDHKGPTIFLFNYFARFLSTNHINGIWFLEVVSIFIFLLMTYKIAKLWLNDSVSFIPVVVISIVLPVLLEGGNLTEEYALPFIAYSMYAFIKYIIEDPYFKQYEIILIGGSFAAVFLLRPNLIALWIVFSGYIFFNLLIKKEFKKLFTFFVLFIAGIIITILPVFIYLLWNNALEAAYFQTWTFNISYLSGTENRSGNIQSQYDVLKEYFLPQIFGIYLLFFLVRLRKLSKNIRILHILGILFSIVSIYFTFLSGRPYKHYLMIVLPIFIIPIIFILDSIFSKNKKWLVSFLLVIAVLFIYKSPIEENIIEGYIINGRTDKLTNEMTMEYKYVINKINNQREALEDVTMFIEKMTDGNDRIYSHRLAGNFYLHTQRLSSIKYFNLPSVDLDKSPIIANDFIHEFISSKTKLVVLKKSFQKGEKSNVEQEFYEYIQNKYKLAYEQYDLLVYLLQ